MAVGALIASVIVSAYAAQQQAEASREAGKRAEESRRVGRAQQQLKERAATRQQIRRERIRRAQIIAASEASGTAGASSETGALSSLATRTASNVANIDTQTAFSDRQSQLLQQAANIRTTAATRTAAAGVVSKGSSTFGGTQTATNLDQDLFGE